MKRPTSKDVAERAGVSQTLVSFVLNNRPDVSPETRLRVQQAARELGYRPNLTARNLVQGRTNAIGVLIPNLTDPLFATIAHHIEHAIREEGYQFLLSTSRSDTWSDPDQLRKLVDDLVMRPVDALIAWSPSAGLSEIVSSTGIDTPIFAIGRCEHAKACAFLDHIAGGKLATEHLIACGRTRLDIVGRHDSAHNPGFLQALQTAGIARERNSRLDLVPDFNTEAAGYNIGRQIAALSR